MNDNTEKQTALVVGGCRGIGRAISLRLANDGFDIYASCRKQNEDSASLVSEIRGIGSQCKILEFDVCDRDGVHKVFENEFQERFPDIVVYN